MRKKAPLLTILLSALPGFSHIYLGRIKKGLSLLVIDTGMVLTLIFADSYIMTVIMVNIYFFTFLPACIETYQISKYGKGRTVTESRWYVVVLLLSTGFSALPLLWQSSLFSRKAKIGWTVAVPVLAVIFFTFLIRYWSVIETFFGSLFSR
ncbi:MAG: hypothetical protein GF375_01550 [Candidatus Omnitrophica bacterium]|nr:hypothetical protein [Candidatus Omnitrophota bacterium]